MPACASWPLRRSRSAMSERTRADGISDAAHSGEVSADRGPSEDLTTGTGAEVHRSSRKAAPADGHVIRPNDEKRRRLAAPPGADV